MRICSKLFYDINFEPDAVQPCCNVHWIRVPRFPFSGGQLNIEAYAEHISRVIDELQNSDTLCKGCPDLQELDCGNSLTCHSLIRTVSMNMHRFQCNCRCVYCDLWRNEGKSRGYPILPSLQSLAKQQVLDKKCFFSWGGGEPTILHDFEAASLWIQEQGYKQYIHTNALRYSPAVENLLLHGKGAVNISLDSASPSVYSAVKGVDAFSKVVEHIRRYAAAARTRDLVQIKYIVFDKNKSLNEIARFLELCLSLRVRLVQYSLNFVEINTGKMQTSSLLGAAFLRHHAAELGLYAVPFFIPPAILKTIDALELEHFGSSKKIQAKPRES